MVTTDGDSRRVHAPAHTRMTERTWEHFLVQQVTDGVIVIGAGDNILQFNPAAEAIFRISASEVLGTSVGQFVPERFREHHGELVTAFLDSESAPREMLNREPVPALRADGEEFFADIALVPLTIDGAPAAACVVRDVTRRLDAEAANLQAERLESLRILSAGLAHDFNNILTTIMGNAEYAMIEVGDDSPAYLALHDIKQAGARAAEMVQQMLRFAGRSEVELEHVDVGPVVLEMCRLLQPSLRHGINLATDVPAHSPCVLADHTSIRQIVMNLVMNAAEAIGSGHGSIIVAVAEKSPDRRTLRGFRGLPASIAGPFVAISVTDDGPGMDRATRDRIFDPFFSTKFAGRGLGLASVLGIIRSLKGGIRVTSERGAGTRFDVILPACTPTDAPLPSATQPGRQASPL